MNVGEQIERYVSGQPEPKRSDLQKLHGIILKIMPDCRLWFLDGKDDTGKIVSNPSIGYGFRTIKYADGKTRDFYQVGLSTHKTGISVYIFGIEDKQFLARTFGNELGKATVTGYCIRFRKLDDIRIDVLEAAIRSGSEMNPD